MITTNSGRARHTVSNTKPISATLRSPFVLLTVFRLRPLLVVIMGALAGIALAGKPAPKNGIGTGNTMFRFDVRLHR